MTDRLENLTPWKPGQSGNPGGRPRQDAITTALREQLAAQLPEDGRETIADAIAKVLVKKALRGDVRAIREVADRTEGKARQQLSVQATATYSEATLDFSRLSDEQLRQLGDLLELAHGHEKPEPIY